MSGPLKSFALPVQLWRALRAAPVDYRSHSGARIPRVARSASLSITIFVLSISTGAKADGIDEVSLNIDNSFQQSSAGVTSFSGFSASPEVFMQSASDFNGGTMTYLGPASSPGPYLPMTLVPLTGDPLILAPTNLPSGFPTLAALNAAFPFGTYKVDLTNSVTSASESVTLSYPQNYFPTPTIPPHLTSASYASLQGLNASSAVDLQFNSVAPNTAATEWGTTLIIFGPAGSNVFETELPSAATDFVLPANKLAAGATYTLSLQFVEGYDAANPVNGAVSTPLFFNLGAYATFTTAAGPTPPQTLINVPGGSILAPVLLPPGPVQSVSSPIGGSGASDFYQFYWGGGGPFETMASIAGGDMNANYDFELIGNDGLKVDLILDAANDFTATINENLLLEGVYEIGLVANSPFDPKFTIDFVTPVDGVSSSAPEPSTWTMMLIGFAGFGFTAYRRMTTKNPPSPCLTTRFV